MLIHLLARHDAVWFPRCIGPGITKARQTYRATGLPWSSGERTDASRTRASRILEELVAAGHVTAAKNARSGRTEHISLTESGEVLAQAISMNPSVLDSWAWAIFNAIKLRADKCGWNCHVPEDDLVPAWRTALQPTEEWGRVEALVDIAHCLIPFAVRGWIEGGLTGKKNARYWLGPKAAEARRPAIACPEVDDDTAQAGADFYAAAFDFAYGHLPPADPQEIGEIPLCVAARHDDEIAAWTLSREMASRGE